ncbi:hypothetical protein C8Q77DRAFT_1160441 [Trametes polyzona]|nr:hypothetical protein C8Q77DRAFT_1160441 [Trametes polyzona]
MNRPRGTARALGPQSTDPHVSIGSTLTQEPVEPKKKALLVGINYINAPPGAEYRALEGSHATAAALKELLTISGHSGQRTRKTTNCDEDGLDEILIPCDYYDDTDRPLEDRVITDHELRQLLVDPLPEGAEITAIFDTCHSERSLLDFDLDSTSHSQPVYVTLGLGNSKMPGWLHLIRRNCTNYLHKAALKISAGKRLLCGIGHSDLDPGAGRPYSVRVYQRRYVGETGVLAHAVILHLVDPDKEPPMSPKERVDLMFSRLCQECDRLF